MNDSTKTTTAEALLGMLSVGAKSGYELKGFIHQSIGYFWNESFGQIYPTLKRLEKDGLVVATEGERSGSKVYALTEAGRERLRAWLGMMPRAQVMRNEMLLKLFFGSQVAAATMRSHVAQYRDQRFAEVQTYSGIRARIQSRFAGHPALPYWLITLNWGQIEAEALLRWSEETLVTLDAMVEAGR